MGDALFEHGRGGIFVGHVQRIEIARHFSKALDVVCSDLMHGFVRLFEAGKFSHSGMLRFFRRASLHA